MSSKLNQRDVNRVHTLHAQGLDNHAIARALGVSKATPAYVLRHRPATGLSCDRCGVDVGDNRARVVKTSGDTRAPCSWRFCPGCHGWVFDAANYHKAKRYAGIF